MLQLTNKITKNLILFASLLSPLALMSAPVIKVIDNGPSSNRVDIAITCDGYTSSEMGKFSSDTQTILDKMFSVEPFKEYKDYFNVRLVQAISNESGVDNGSYGNKYKDTAFDGAYSGRLTRFNPNKVIPFLQENLISTEREIMMLILNDHLYGAAAIAGVAAVAAHSTAGAVIMHELGHSFAKLGDEYTYGHSQSQCLSKRDPWKPNISKQTQRDKIKWKHWIDANTPIPTTGYEAHTPGLFDGAYYCQAGTGFHRPSMNSKMRTVARPFEEVNEEQLILRIYMAVNPIDSREPSASQVTMSKDETKTFTLNLLTPQTYSLDVVWKLNGSIVGTGSSYSVSSTLLNSGANTLSYIVKDDTAKVRNDTRNLLQENGQWTINYTGTTTTNNPPVANAGADKTVTVNTNITITGSGSDSDGTIASYKWMQGTTFLSNQQSFTYSFGATGTKVLTLTVTDNDGASHSDNMSVVVSDAVVVNVAPVANAGADKTVTVNTNTTITGSGSDSDGYVASYKWMQGSTILSNSASFTHSFTHAGTKILTLTVTDNDGASHSDSLSVVVSDTVVANVGPTANAGGDKTVALGHSIVITGTASDSDGTIVSYKWTLEGAVVSTLASFTYTPKSVGNKVFRFRVTDNDGASSSKTMTLHVTEATPQPVKADITPIILYLLN